MRSAPIVQGDVILEKIDTIPAGEQTTTPLLAAKILARGDSTGNTHAFRGQDAVRAFLVSGKTYIEAVENSVLVHTASDGAHDPVDVAAGIYEMRIARETDHLEGVTRAVAD